MLRDYIWKEPDALKHPEISEKKSKTKVDSAGSVIEYCLIVGGEDVAYFNNRDYHCLLATSHVQAKFIL